MPPRRGGAPRLIDWTGERCVPWTPDVQVAYEHYHRYLWARTLVEGREVLDLGSGEGFGAALLRDRARSVVGIDIDPTTVDHARLNYGGDGLEFRVGTATDLGDVPDASFDVVVAFEILEHVLEQEAMLDGIRRVLRPGGLVVLSTPDRRAYSEATGQNNPFHLRELTLAELRELVGGRFPHAEYFAQRTMTGSRIEELATDGAAGGHLALALERAGDEWRVAGPPSPMYLLAVMSAEPLPATLHAESTLSDFGLELLRVAERARDAALNDAAEARAASEREVAAARAAREAAASEFDAVERQRVSAERELEAAAEADRRRIDEAQRQLQRELIARCRELDGLRGELLRRDEDLEQARAEAASSTEELRRQLRRVDESVVWQAFQRTRGRVYAALGGPASLRGRALSAMLRLLGGHRRRVPVEATAEIVVAAEPPAFVPFVVPQFPEPEASIVIPVHADATLTQRCLSAILHATDEASYEVILVDDAADRGTKALLAAVEGARIIVNEENLNYLRSVNRGAAVARGRHIVLLNNDTEPQPGWLRALIDRVESAPDVGVVAAKLVYPDGRLQEAGGLVWRDGTPWNYGHGADPGAPQFNFVREVDYGSGAALLVRADVWRALGGYDERYAPAYYEDADLCFAARDAGWRVLYEPRATVVHVEGASQGTDVTQGGKANQVANAPKFVEKWQHVLHEQVDGARPERAPLAADRRRGPHALIIDHRVPTPDQDSGSLRMWHLIRNLLDLGWTVTFIPDNFAIWEPYTSSLQGLGVEVLYGNVNVALAIAERSTRTRLAIISRPYVAPRYVHLVREHAPAARIAYDTVDLHFLRELRRAEHEGRDRAKADAFKEIELGIARACDVTLVVSDEEADHLRALDPSLDVAVVSNANEIWSAVPAWEGRSGVFFVGGFEHEPNIDAVEHLARAIMPLVWRELPDLELTIVGAHAPAAVQSLAGPNIAVPGWVPDMRPYLERSFALVAPLRYGAGVKGKVTQSLAAGLPVVTTTLGAEGLEAVDGRDLFVADHPERFAQRIVELCRDESTWQTLSSNGQALVADRSSVEAQRRALERLVCNRNPVRS